MENRYKINSYSDLFIKKKYIKNNSISFHNKIFEISRLLNIFTEMHDIEKRGVYTSYKKIRK